MSDALDVELHDSELIEEINLVSELMVAAVQSSVPLSQAEVDAILAHRHS